MKSLTLFTVVSSVVAALALTSTDASAARLGGPALHTDRVVAGGRDVYTETFTAGTALFEVKGDGDTDLDCFVLENGVVVASDEDDNDDHCVVSFTARRTTTVQLVIRNYGNVYNEYTMLVR